MKLGNIMLTLPREVQMKILDNVMAMTSVVANVKRGAWIVTTRVYGHAAIEGQVAWNKVNTGVSVDGLLCTLDSIRALHVTQVHAIEHCMQLLQDFMTQFNLIPSFKYSLLYGDLASFIVTFGLYQDFAVSKHIMTKDLPTAAPTEVVEIEDDGDIVDNATLDGKLDIPNFNANLFKPMTLFKFPAPAAKRYAKTAAAMLYSMRYSVHEKTDTVVIKCENLAMAIPKWVIKDAPGRGKRPLVALALCRNAADRVYVWLQDVFLACRDDTVAYSDRVLLYDVKKKEQFLALYTLGKALLDDMKRAPGAPKKRRRVNTRGPLNDIVMIHKF